MNIKHQNTNLLLILLIAVLLMVIIYQQLFIYSQYGGRDIDSILAQGKHIVLNEKQINDLTIQIINNTPEHTHFEPGAKFKWVIISADSLSIQKELFNSVINEFKKHYSVYLSKDNIPKEYISKNDQGETIDYIDGFRFSYSLEFFSKNKIRIHYNDWEGELAASNYWILYKWTRNKWQTIKKGPMCIS